MTSTIVLDPFDPTRALVDGQAVHFVCTCGRPDCGARLGVEGDRLVIVTVPEHDDDVVLEWTPSMVLVVLATLAAWAVCLTAAVRWWLS